MATRAVIYARTSLDKSGEGAGVQRQLADCRAYAKRKKQTVIAEYVDNSKSAMNGNRPEFERLLADVEAGGIDTIIVWAADRFYRRVTELERIIDALGDVPVEALHSGAIDLSSPQGRMVARILGSVAQAEVEQKGLRQQRANQQRAEAGISRSARRPFGWKKAGEGFEPDPVEGPAVADGYRLLLAGVSLSQIAREWNAQGLTGSRGGAWTQARVSAVLRAPRHGGLVHYQGKVQPVENAEGSLVTEDVWKAAQSVLNDPRRNPNANGGGRPAGAVLTGLAECYRCGSTVRPASNSVDAGKSRAAYRYLTYACNDNHVSWRREELDALVVPEILAQLEANLEVLRAAELERQAAAADTKGPRAEVDRLRRQQADLATMLADGTLDAAAYRDAVTAITAALEVAEKQIARSAPSPMQSMFDSPLTVAETWESLSVKQRNDIAKALIDRVIVHPARVGEVEIEWAAA